MGKNFDEFAEGAVFGLEVFDALLHFVRTGAGAHEEHESGV